MSYDNEVESYDYKGHTIHILPDEDGANPIEEYDMASTLVCFHRRYNLGHNNVKPSKYGGSSADRSDFSSPEEFAEFVKKTRPTLVCPLYLYDHSGITISMGKFSCPWDSGQVGYVYMTRDTILKEWGQGKKRLSKKMIEQAKKYMAAVVEEYDNYLTGQIYCYTVTDKETGEAVESCGGYSGYEMTYEDSDLVADAKSAIDSRIETIAEGLPEAALI